MNKKHHDILLSGVENWNEYVIKNNLEYANLEGAELQGANLQGANLQEANLKGANLECANLILANLKLANLQWSNLNLVDFTLANLQEANLIGANLKKTNLQGANLQGANLDFACMSFSCKDLYQKLDDRLFYQRLIHLVKHDYSQCEDKEIIEFLNMPLVIKLANKFHKIGECGIYKGVENESKSM